jgi:glycosyltransferase involved in cell wall biosynthesis
MKVGSMKAGAGTVFNAFDTNYWKAKQLAQLIDTWELAEWDNKTVLFFGEAWYPGIEMVGYINAFLSEDKRVKVVGCLHGGAYDPYDFTNTAGMEWAHDFDEVIYYIFDRLFLASSYHEKLASGPFSSNQLCVTGHPFYREELRLVYPPAVRREPLVLFPHRLDASKGHEDFDKIIAVVRDYLPRVEFTAEKTYETCQGDPKKFYDRLRIATAVVSCAKQETFGTAMLEATALGAVPVVPDRLAYPEMYSDEYRYENLGHAADLVYQALRGELEAPVIPSYTQAIENMINVCQSLVE